MSPHFHDLDDLIVTVSELLVASADNSDTLLDGSVEQVLRTVRQRLRLDVVFVGEFVAGRRVFRFVDADLGMTPVQAGDSEDLETTYCKRVVDGRLPQFIANTASLPADARPAAGGLRVGTHLSTPVVLQDGSIYGTLCCYSVAANVDSREQDVTVLRHCARLVARKLDLAHSLGLRERTTDFADTDLAPEESAIWQRA